MCVRSHAAQTFYFGICALLLCLRRSPHIPQFTPRARTRSRGLARSRNGESFPQEFSNLSNGRSGGHVRRRPHSSLGTIRLGCPHVEHVWRPASRGSGCAVWKSSGIAAGSAIVVNGDEARQEMLGFGAAMTDASCYVLSQMKEEERGAVMHDLFSPQEMALNVCRTCIGASDYSRTLYSFDESSEPDPELKKFSIDHDQAVHSADVERGAQSQPRAVPVSRRHGARRDG